MSETKHPKYVVVEWFRHGPDRPRFTVILYDPTIDRLCTQERPPFKVRYRNDNVQRCKHWIETVGSYLETWVS